MRQIGVALTVVVLAMAAGTVLITSRVDGISEYADDTNSVLCAPTPDGIVDAVRRTAGLSAERRHALITAGLETARRYRWDCIAASLRDVYRQAVGEAT